MKVKVINLNDENQINRHKIQLNNKIYKLQKEKEELEKLQKEKLEKEKTEALIQAKRLARGYAYLDKTTFRDENEMYEIIRVDAALKTHFKKHYSFVKDMFIGWTDKRCKDKALYFKFKAKTASIEKMIEFQNDANFYYRRTYEIAKDIFDCVKADEITMATIEGEKWLRFWWD